MDRLAQVCALTPRLVLAPHSRARTFMLLAEQSFNYDIQGQSGFDAVTALIDSTQCYQFTYSSLDDAHQVFNNLLQGQV